MSGLNRKTAGLKLRTFHVKFIRENSTQANTKLYIMYTKDPLIKEHFLALVQLHHGSVMDVAKILRT